MGRVYAVGDIHGEASLLASLLMTLEQVFEPDDRLLFLGDYVDRGPDSRGVIDQVIDRRRRYPGRVECLKGNHEHALLEWLRQPSEFWLAAMGGAETVASYLPDRTISEQQDPTAIARQFAAALPSEHRMFLDELRLWYRWEGYFFSHAGLNPHRPIEQQTEADFVATHWEDLLPAWHGPPTLVIGHVPTYKIGPQYRGKPYLREDIILTDTGSVRTGVLSAVRLPDRLVFQARRLEPNDGAGLSNPESND